MATQTILWTVLPAGRVTEGALKGRLKVSVVASPRLTPERANERELRAFPEWLLWPRTVAEAKFGLRIGNTLLPLEPLGPLAGQAQPDVDLWSQLFAPETPVDGFVFKDMSRVNLRSYAVRNVLGLARKYYAQLAVGATSRHPTLLPWSSANPALRAMLIDMGAPREVGAERQGGFARFFNDGDGGIEQVLRNSVFGPKSKYSGTAAGIGVDRGGNPVNGASFPVRVLPPDWQPPNGTPDTELMANWASAAEYTLYQADRFYRREPLSADALAMRRPSGKDIPPPPESQTLDFHKRLASYSDYPALLRRLGVLLDFVLPAENPIDQQVRQQGNAQGTMQLDLRWANDHDPGVDGCPATAWQADSQRFTARPRTNDHHMGMLRLGGANDRWDQSKRIPFDVYQVDPDGTALKTVDFVLSAQRLIDKSRKSGTDGAVTYTTGDDQPVAALRAGGIGVSRHGRAAALAFGAASSAAKDGAVRSGAAASAGIALFTEDVLRGYRVDVQPIIGGKPGRWQSLCRRQGAYQIAATGAKLSLPADDEGYVKGASTTSTANPASGADPDDHYLHESLFRWAGWSLVVPRPGRTLRAQDGDSGVQAEVPTDVTDAVAAADGNGILTSFVAAKGSLPRLRFGFAYRLRARLVDLAGNSLDVDDPSLGDGENELEVTQPVTYWRFEPVDPPVLVQRARASEGESLERMVIRSNYDADPATFLTTGAFADAIKLPASADFAYTPANERHVVPPKASQTLCETHGLFDPMFGSASGIRDAYALAARESGTLYDAGPGTDVALITPTALANVATTVAVPPALPSLDNPTGDRLAAGQYVIHREARVPTPWLPDVAAGGIALRAAPGSRLPGVTGPMSLGAGAEIVAIPGNELVLMVAFDQRWPDTRGLRIVLAERVGLLADPPCQVTYPDDGTPRWDADARTLTFFLPKGQIARLTYASFVHPDLIGTFGLPDWVDTAAEKALLQQMALTGAAWMLTPYRPLVLVHATQQPVCTPEFLTELGKARSPGDRFAKLGARVRVHGPSTGKLELQATWTEWIDDPADAAGPRIAQCEG
ncbi:MAG TPA: hypothetical protein DD502_14070, partial [Cupriavidus sp.]|nr:hypothetical protein [Cupriavidus sp.]